MFEQLDSKSSVVQEYNSQNVITSLKTNNLDLLCTNLYNVFEEIVPERSKILHLKELLMQNGAVASLMSGSGSSVFGIFNDKELSKKAYRNLKDSNQAFWCISYNKRK